MAETKMNQYNEKLNRNETQNILVISLRLIVHLMSFFDFFTHPTPPQNACSGRMAGKAALKAKLAINSVHPTNAKYSIQWKKKKETAKRTPECSAYFYIGHATANE